MHTTIILMTVFSTFLAANLDVCYDEDSDSGISNQTATIGDILQVQVDFAKLVGHLNKIKRDVRNQKAKQRDLK